MTFKQTALRASCIIISAVSNVTLRQLSTTVLVSFRFSSQIQYEAHERKLCGPAEQCDICGRIFKFAITLERHKQRSHVESKCYSTIPYWFCGYFYLVLARRTYSTVNQCLWVFTVRKRSCGNVMFLHLSSVILFTAGDRCTPPGRHKGVYTPQTDTPWARHPPPRDGHCIGRYASYWNAFLCKSRSSQES